MTKISPAALNALKAALAVIYWYKQDLRSFLTNCMDDATVLASLNWDDYKRNIVDRLVDHLATHESRYQSDLLRLISEVARFDDFGRLKTLDDGERKEADARTAVAALRKQAERHLELVEEQQESKRRRGEAQEKQLRNIAAQQRLDELRENYVVLVGLPPQERGYALEPFMNQLFDLFDLDPKKSFRATGEQIDGMFSFQGTDYLFETRWRDAKTPRDQLDVFQAKLKRKLENTLGLFISISGFVDAGVCAYSNQGSRMILMDGADLMAVLESRIALDRLLLLKRRRAAQKGEIYVPFRRL